MGRQIPLWRAQQASRSTKGRIQKQAISKRQIRRRREFRSKRRNRSREEPIQRRTRGESSAAARAAVP